MLTHLSPHIRVAPALHLRSPGEVLLQDYMQPMSLTAAQLARRSRIPAERICELMRGSRRVTPQLALRLAMTLDTSAFYWLLLQAHHDLQDEVRRHPLLGAHAP